MMEGREWMLDTVSAQCDWASRALAVCILAQLSLSIASLSIQLDLHAYRMYGRPCQVFKCAYTQVCVRVGRLHTSV